MEKLTSSLSAILISILYGSAGEFKHAEELLLKALTINKKMIGVDHPKYAGTLSNLAGVYYQKGDSLNAESLFVEANNILHKTLLNEHANKEDRAWALYYLPQNLNYMGLLAVAGYAIK
jgi:tetratricopeptide (TPR) repeat protein